MREGMPDGAPGDRLTSFCNDLRSHIAAAATLASPREADEQLPEAVRHRLALLREQLAVLSALVSAQLPEQASARVRTDVTELVEASARTVGIAHGVEVEVRTKGRAVVHAEPTSLRRAIVNVLANAARASVAGPVVVRVRHERGTALVEVDDDGPGFGEIEGGLGLGLRQAEQAVRAAGGRVSIGRSPRGGTLVRLVLPTKGVSRTVS